MRFVSAVLIAAAMIFLSGCQLGNPVKMEPTSLNYKSQESLAGFDQSKQKLIRVAQFIDKRPKEEIKGAAPIHWQFLVAGYQNGNFITSDRPWTEGGSGSVSDAVTSSMAECLKQTKFFDRVEVESSPEPSGGQGLILKGEINSLQGRQHVSRNYVVYFHEHEQKAAPEGHCKLTYRLIDAETNQVLKSNTLDAEVKDNRLTVPEAGHQALSAAVTLVSNEVTIRALNE